MSASAKDRALFVGQLVRAMPDKPVHVVERAAALLMRHAATHGRLAEAECNGHPLQSRAPFAGYSREAWNAMVNKAQAEHEAWIEKRQAQIERRMSAICAELGLTADFGGDPRGYTVKVHLPTGASNTWGGREDGYGVPQ